jgi:FkbM family methyltransferase
MTRLFRDLAASVVLKRFPQLIYYLADRNVRSNLRVSAKGPFIDIVEVSGNRGIRIGRRTAAYTLDMINFFDYYFSSVEPVEAREKRGIRQLVDFSTPRFQKVTGFDDFPVLCPSIPEPYTTTDQYVDFAQLREGDVVFDLGGYSGLTSIAFSKQVGATGRVITLEPDPSNFAASTTNIELHARNNGLENIELLPLAVSGSRGVMQLAAEGSMGSAEVSIVGRYRNEVIDVEMLTLQDLVDRCGLSKVDFIKIDIEGSELKVLAAGKDFLQRFWPKLIIEPHMVNGKLTEGPVKKILTDLGYVCKSIPQHGVTLPLITATPPARQAADAPAAFHLRAAGR